MNERDEVRLRDMRDNAIKARQFTDGKTRADLDMDEMLAYAVVRAIEIIGEVASKVTAETRNQYSQIEWRNIVGIRNRIVHDYTHVNLDIVWEVVTQNLPELIEQLDDILPPWEDDENESPD